MSKRIHLLFCLVIVILLSSSMIQAQDDDPFVIAATATHVADLARVIAGDTAEIINIIGPGLNPHDYRFTERDSQTLRNADMVLYSGLGFEGYVEVTLEEFERQKPVYGVLNVVRDQGVALPSGEEEGLVNSHAWHDPRNWMLATQGLADFLSIYDPDNADIYQANASAYLEQLELLLDWSQEAMDVVPEDERILVSAHDAFAYFVYAYGWRVASVQGINTADEAGISDIQAITNFVITNRVRAIFIESSLPADTIEAVVASAQNQDWDVRIGGELLADSMNEPGRFTGTYIGMMYFNINLVISAYGYDDLMPAFPAALPQPPETGM